MYQLIKKSCAILILFNMCFALGKTQGHAEQPFNFTSKRVTYNAKNHTVVYHGNVKVTQGSIHLAGDKLTLFLTSNNQINKFIDIGHPATYVGQMNHRQGPIDALADKITYDTKHQLIYLDQHAIATQNHNTIKAAHISYNRKTGTIHAIGDQQQSLTHITIFPNK